jgi:hypothetical protein
MKQVLQLPRGGSTAAIAEEEEEEEVTATATNPEDPSIDDVRRHPDFISIQNYRMQQQALLQLRGYLLAETLARRGLPIPNVEDAMKPDGETVPERKVDWDCAISTRKDPKYCLIAYANAEEGAKCIAPIQPKDGVTPDSWITMANLNRLRRNDPTKVVGLWNNKYDVLYSWFAPASEFSLLQHVGPTGVLLNTLLNDKILPLVVGLCVLFTVVLFMPIIEYLVNRILVSAWVWNNWVKWARFTRLGFPFRLMVGRIVVNYLGKGFRNLVKAVKEYLVEIECAILEETIPLTLGVPTPVHVEDDSAEILVDEDEVLENLALHPLDDDDDDDDGDDFEVEEEDDE